MDSNIRNIKVNMALEEKIRVNNILFNPKSDVITYYVKIMSNAIKGSVVEWLV